MTLSRDPQNQKPRTPRALVALLATGRVLVRLEVGYAALAFLLLVLR